MVVLVAHHELAQRIAREHDAEKADEAEDRVSEREFLEVEDDVAAIEEIGEPEPGAERDQAPEHAFARALAVQPVWLALGAACVFGLESVVHWGLPQGAAMGSSSR